MPILVRHSTHNAHVERVFSLIKTHWTDERNSLSIDTVKSIIQCVLNYKMSCIEFYNYIKGEKELLQKTKTSEKYDWAKKSDDKEATEVGEGGE